MRSRSWTMRPHTTIQFSFIHNNETGFDLDLFAIDKLWIVNGKVDYAERVFSISAPEWLKKRIFGASPKVDLSKATSTRAVLDSISRSVHDHD